MNALYKDKIMPASPGPSRRQVGLIVGFSAILAIIFVTAFRSMPLRGTPIEPAPLDHLIEIGATLHPATLNGPVIAPKLGNETVKAELGRAAWKLFHTVMARFPDEPTKDESEALRSYVHLFQRLYPCGECAEHFREILDKYPPQVSSRSAAAVWACHVHNEVNRSLDKALFDCANIGDFYDCGCAEDEKEAMKSQAKEKLEMPAMDKERLTGANGRDVDVSKMHGDVQYVKIAR